VRPPPAGDPNPRAPRLQVAASPHVHGLADTARIMWSVVASLLPVVLGAVWLFGISALLVIAAATLGALATERAFSPSAGPTGVGDGSATITGLLLGLTLPPGLPLWMAFLGGAFAIAFGKLLFGGLGQNVFNPALVGRAFLQAAFPVALTTWSLPRTAGGGAADFWALRGDNLALPLMGPDPAPAMDAITGATPLGLMKFEGQSTAQADLFLGGVAGSLGETSALLILAGGAWLVWKNYLNWRIPVGVLATVAALSSVLYLLDPTRHPGAPFALFSGGLMLGAVYMATDMVTSPVTNRGAWIFAVGIGLLVVVIRAWSGLPEGVMYSILLMNAMVPFIDRATQPRVFGTRRAPRAGRDTSP
jgi:electron transport complex protein RnfD